MRYAYTAIPISNAGAAAVQGMRDALDERTLRDELRRDGMIAIRVRPVRLGDAIREAMSPDRLRGGDSSWFFQTLSTLLASKVSAESALGTMQELAPTARAGRACRDVRDALRSGSSLADAVGGVKGLASAAHVALLRSGQASGRLDHVVALVDRSIAAGAKLRRTVIAGLTYPAVLVVAAVAALWFISAWVIPRFRETLTSLGGELPMVTEFTIGAARVIMWAAPAALLALIAAFSLRGLWLTPRVRERVSRAVLRLPIVGPLVWHAQGALVADMIATMLEGGADVLSGLEQAQEVATSPEIAARLGAARKQVREGGDVGAALKQHGVLPPMPAAVVQVGVRGGELTSGLRRATEICLERQERITQRLMSLMEPAVIVFMAGAVGWIVYSLVAGMLAMYDFGGG